MRTMRSFFMAQAVAVALSTFADDRLATAPDDGIVDATAALQQVVDAVSASGGGRVTVPPGKYRVCALRLKDNVELHLKRDAWLLSTTNLAEYVEAEKTRKAANSAVYAEGARNVAITGEGGIDGRGAYLDRVIERHPHLVLTHAWNTLKFSNCRDVRVEDVTLLGGSTWTFFLRRCNGVTIRRIRLFGHANYCNDGIDIDAQNVLIEGCDIDAEDDAIVFKTHYAGAPTENVVVRNCRLASNSAVVKFGTESHGPFRHIRVHDCTVSCRTTSHTIGPHKRPGEDRTARNHALTGLEFNVFDGGSIEDVVMSDIRMEEGLTIPIYFSTKHRKMPPAGQQTFLRDVTIERVKMFEPSVSSVANFIDGLPDLRPSDITLRDIDLVMQGGGRSEDPEDLRKKMRPAHGFHIRNADRIRFENVRIRCRDRDEVRPSVITEDADVKFVGCDFMTPVKGSSAKRM